jgi:hypothetical protein
MNLIKAPVMMLEDGNVSKYAADGFAVERAVLHIEM